MSELQEQNYMRYLLSNGTIISDGQSVRTDIAITDGSIVALGRELHTHRDFRGFRRVDVGGAFVLPGLVDAHVHLFNYALTLDRVRLHDCTSITACLKRIQKFASTRSPRAWIVGEGYNPSTFREKREPNATELDAVTGGRPAFIFAKDHHSACVNSATLRIAKINRETPDPPNSTIVRDADGNPSGILRETIAYEFVFRMIPFPSAPMLLKLFREATSIALSKGVTGVHSFDSPEALPHLTRWAEQGKIPLRIAHYARHHALGELERAGIRRGTGTPFFWFAGIKMFADGTLGSRTADCFAPYSDDPGNCGLPTMSVMEMLLFARRAARLGFPCAIHAIGDRAVANALTVLESVKKLKPGVRHRVEHVQLIRPADIKRFHASDIIASMQPTHLPSDIPMIRTRWRDRQYSTYRFRSILRSSATLAGGSDLPIEPIDPLMGIATAIRHGNPNGRAFNRSESLTPAQAVAAFTSGPAYTLGMESKLGRIAPGYDADFSILERNPLTCPTRAIPEIGILATIVRGEVVYSNGFRF